MRRKPVTTKITKPGAEQVVKSIRREGIASSMYYSWSKEFLEAGKKRLAGDTARAATGDEVNHLRKEARDLKEVVAELTLENRLVEQPHLSAKRTLDQLGIPRTTFYRWYDLYLNHGPEGLEDRKGGNRLVWNRMPMRCAARSSIWPWNTQTYHQGNWL